MNRLDIRNAYDLANPTREQKEKMRQRILALTPEETKEGVRFFMKSKENRKWKVIPAILTLTIVLAAGVGLVLGRNGNSAMAFASLTSETAREFIESPQYLANVEWNDYLDNGRSSNKTTVLSEYHIQFQCKNNEMAEKLDALCEKYGLELRGAETEVNDYEKLLKTLNLGPVCIEKNGVSFDFEGYDSSYSAEGDIHFAGELTYENSPWEWPANFAFHRIRKTVFHEGLLGIGDLSGSECWEYTTGSGIKLLLATGEDCALILENQEDAVVFVVINQPRILEDSNDPGCTMERDALEALVKNFDFAQFPEGESVQIEDSLGIMKETADIYNVPSTAGETVGQISEGTEIEVLRREMMGDTQWILISEGWILAEAVEDVFPEETRNTEQVYDAVLETYATALTEGWNQARCAEESISYLVSDFVKMPEKLGYALMDLDGDGKEELIITDGNVILDMYYQTDFGIQQALSGWERNVYYLCEGNTILNRGSGSAASTTYNLCCHSNGGLVQTSSVVYDAGLEQPWSYQQNGNDPYETISEEEANKILDTCVPVSIAFTPITG